MRARVYRLRILFRNTQLLSLVGDTRGVTVDPGGYLRLRP
jgi:hypothetical protein